jgi:hypothetical protein
MDYSKLEAGRVHCTNSAGKRCKIKYVTTKTINKFLQTFISKSKDKKFHYDVQNQKNNTLNIPLTESEKL